MVGHPITTKALNPTYPSSPPQPRAPSPHDLRLQTLLAIFTAASGAPTTKLTQIEGLIPSSSLNKLPCPCG
jgi:hypothetical protein